MRGVTDGDIHVLLDRLMVQVVSQNGNFGDTLEDIRDSTAESSKPALEPQSSDSIYRSERDATFERIGFFAIRTGINRVRSDQSVLI